MNGPQVKLIVIHVQLTLETGEIGRQANGAVTLTYGDTVSLQADLLLFAKLHPAHDQCICFATA